MASKQLRQLVNMIEREALKRATPPRAPKVRIVQVPLSKQDKKLIDEFFAAHPDELTVTPESLSAWLDHHGRHQEAEEIRRREQAYNAERAF